jgi:undecaprenyl-diphosphatase
MIEGECMNIIAMLDLEILLFIQNFLRSSFLTPIFRLITSLGDFGSIWLVISIFLILYKKTRRIGLYALLGYVLCSLSVDILLKNIVQRPRPFTLYEAIIPLIKEPSSYSFPSGHTVKAFSVAFILYRIWDKRIGVVFIIIASLIAFSRIYLGVHFFSDIVGGILVGWVISMAVTWLYKKQQIK